MTATARKLHLVPPKEGGVSGVPTRMVWDVWPHVAKYFQSFEERSQGRVTAGELLKMVLENRRQMWVAVSGGRIKACGLTEVLESGVVGFDFCAGEDREEWRDEMVAEIERYAAGRQVVIICRPGWARELKRLGYRETHRVLEKETGK